MSRNAGELLLVLQLIEYVINNSPAILTVLDSESWMLLSNSVKPTSAPFVIHSGTFCTGENTRSTRLILQEKVHAE